MNRYHWITNDHNNEHLLLDTLYIPWNVVAGIKHLQPGSYQVWTTGRNNEYYQEEHHDSYSEAWNWLRTAFPEMGDLSDG